MQVINPCVLSNELGGGEDQKLICPTVREINFQTGQIPPCMHTLRMHVVGGAKL